MAAIVHALRVACGRVRDAATGRPSTSGMRPIACGASVVAGVFRSETASGKLEVAAETMRQRVATLESRAATERSESVSLAKAGQRAGALRMLRRAKVTESTAARNADALLAVEQQTDMLAQAALQKQVSSALASSSKAMKGGAKILSGAEKAIDDAQEARDVANDLASVMSEFAQAAGADTGDDDELLKELDAMLVGDGPPPSSKPESHTQTRVVLPNAPKTRVQLGRLKEEKTHLLFADASTPAQTEH
jgi:hypothetical protein